MKTEKCDVCNFDMDKGKIITLLQKGVKCTENVCIDCYDDEYIECFGDRIIDIKEYIEFESEEDIEARFRINRQIKALNEKRKTA